MFRLICRKVCRCLRSTVEKLEILFDSISFAVSDNDVTMKLDGCKILYNDAANGATIVPDNEKETMIKGENFLQVAFNDLGILLKRVKYFEFEIYGEDEHAMATYLLNVLKANQCVHVKEIVISFLSLIDMYLGWKRMAGKITSLSSRLTILHTFFSYLKYDDFHKKNKLVIKRKKNDRLSPDIIH